MDDTSKFTFERVSISTLKPMPKNTRKHSERNIKVIAESLRRFGQQKNIVVDANNVVLAGNGTVEAAKLLGWDTIDIKRSDLKANDAKAYSVTDNHSATFAEYDQENLEDALRDLGEDEYDMTDLGWDDNLNAIHLDDDEDSEPKDKPLTIIVTFKNDGDQQALFIELRDRGFKVKV